MRNPRLRVGLPIVLLSAMSASAARADLFILPNQGIIQGELVNKNETPRVKYIIDTIQGGQITLEKDQVLEVRRESAAQQEYEKVRGQYPDTVDGHWRLSEWCRQNLLLPTREVHLKRILELEPDHELARRGLGYTKSDGKWTTQDETMTSRGYVKYKGKWMLPQEVELLEAERQAELVEKEWIRDIKRLREDLNTSKSDKALESIKKIADPNAIPAIRGQLEIEKNPQIRKLWVQALGRIDAPGAGDLLVQISLHDVDNEIRLCAVDELVAKKQPGSVNLYLKALRTNDNPTINRAAIGLAALKDPAAMGPLIDVLVTTHKYKVTEGSQGIATRFPTGGSGAGGLSMGSKTTIVNQKVSNESVRDALVQLAGVNYNFEVEKWQAWLAQRQKEALINVRRD